MDQQLVCQYNADHAERLCASLSFKQLFFKSPEDMKLCGSFYGFIKHSTSNALGYLLTYLELKYCLQKGITSADELKCFLSTLHSASPPKNKYLNDQKGLPDYVNFLFIQSIIFSLYKAHSLLFVYFPVNSLNACNSLFMPDNELMKISMESILFMII